MDRCARRVRAGRARGWREWRRAVLDLLLPPHCPGCGAQEDGSGRLVHGLCAACRAHLRGRPAPRCRRCGSPVLGPGLGCGTDHRALLGIAFARAPFAYAGTGGQLVRRLKFRGEFGAAPLLGAAMARALLADLPRRFRRAVLVPVPLHRDRRRSRGFDQAALLAEEVRLRTGLAVERALRRRAATLPQGDPRVGSREQNVARAFAVARPRAVAGRHVVLVDDVATSGATARACAAVLRAAGASGVGLLSACRAG